LTLFRCEIENTNLNASNVHLMCIYVHLYFRSLTGGRMFCRQEKPRENLIHQHAIQKYNPIAAIACLNDFKCTVSPYITLGTVVPFGLATEKGAGATPLGTVIWKLRPLRLCTAREAFPLEFVEMPWIIWISGFSMFLYVSVSDSSWSFDGKWWECWCWNVRGLWVLGPISCNDACLIGCSLPCSRHMGRSFETLQTPQFPNRCCSTNTTSHHCKWQPKISLG